MVSPARVSLLVVLLVGNLSGFPSYMSGLRQSAQFTPVAYPFCHRVTLLCMQSEIISIAGSEETPVFSRPAGFGFEALEMSLQVKGASSATQWMVLLLPSWIHTLFEEGDEFDLPLLTLMFTTMFEASCEVVTLVDVWSIAPERVCEN